MQRVLAFAAALSACAVTVAAAEPYAPQPIVRHIQVSAADLNLNTQDGARVMARRIAWAARRACGAEGADFVRLTTQTYHRCRDAAIDDALARLNAPLVTAESGRSVNPTLAHAGAD